MSETLFVVVPEPKSDDEVSRVCPIHRNDNPHGGDVMLAVGDDALEVFNSTSIRRRIRSGDLREAKKEEIDAAKKKAADVEKSNAEKQAKQKADADKANAAATKKTK